MLNLHSQTGLGEDELKNIITFFSAGAQSRTALLLNWHGLMIHCENYVHSRDIAKIGWKLFTDILQENSSQVTPLEGIWIIEKLGISYAKYTELRLRLLDRIYLPPEHMIKSFSRAMTPEVESYKHGIRAQLKAASPKHKQNASLLLIRLCSMIKL